jgi:undecaprenyl diphosphate synthase
MSVLAGQTKETPAPIPERGMPAHVAIIMDGNGRWAMARGLPRGEGHRRGVEAVRNIVKAAVELRLPYLTLFSFSSENWTRPPEEVDFLFGLFRRYIRRDVAELHAAGVCIHVIGRRDGLPSDILAMIEEAERLTAANAGLKLVVAFNYGARDEIARAARKIALAVRDGELDPETVDEATVERFLDTARLPDPDLIIRTSGELRLSNFLLWQSAYAELVFVPVYWPDFNRATLSSALEEYAGRSRRYGGTGGRSAG